MTAVRRVDFRRQSPMVKGDNVNDTQKDVAPTHPEISEGNQNVLDIMCLLVFWSWTFDYHTVNQKRYLNFSVTF